MGWKTIEPLPVARWRCGAAALKNYVYVAGGCSDSAQATPVLSILKSRINAVDDGSGPWLSCAPVMTDGKIGVGMVLLGPDSEIVNGQPGNGFIVLIGGRGATVTGVGLATAQDVYVGKLDSDGNVPKWLKQTSSLPVPLVDCDIVIFAQYMYLVGGSQVTTQLDFNTQTVNFTVGDIITGATSGATGKLVSQVDAGATGTLVLSGVTGTFQAAENITDQHTGAAKAVAAQYFFETPSTIIYRAHIDSNGSIEPFSALKDLLPAAVAPRNAVMVMGMDNLIVADSGNLYTANLNFGGTLSKFKTSALLTSKVAHAMQAVSANSLMLIGGDSTGDRLHPVADVYFVKIDQDANVIGKWKQTTPMPTAKEDFGFAILRDRVFCIGGLGGSSTVLTECSVARIEPSGTIGGQRA